MRRAPERAIRASISRTATERSKLCFDIGGKPGLRPRLGYGCQRGRQTREPFGELRLVPGRERVEVQQQRVPQQRARRAREACCLRTFLC